jgi:hypothetical protein
MRRITNAVMLLAAFVALPSTDARAQSADGQPDRRGTFFIQGGLLTTALLHDTQESQSGYLHYAYIGTLGWPVRGAQIAGGVRVARRVSVGAEVAVRPANSSTISEQSHGHSDRATLSSLYTSRERLLSFTARGHTGAGRVEVQPLGGLTVSWAKRTLAGRHGFASYPGFPATAISGPDARLAETKFGLVGGADIGVHIGGGVSLIGGPRIHWVAREHVDEYAHIVPNASRIILSIGAGVQWWPRRRR